LPFSGSKRSPYWAPIKTRLKFELFFQSANFNGSRIRVLAAFFMSGRAIDRLKNNREGNPFGGRLKGIIWGVNLAYFGEISL